MRKDRCDTANGIGGGLLVYTKHDIKILPSDKYRNSKFNQFCNFSVVTESEKLDIILIYRPPSSGQDNLTELCEILRTVDENTLLIGDFNLPGIDWEEEQSKDSKGRELLDIATEGGMQQLVNFPTHTKGNILDLVLTNCSDRVLEVSDAGRLGKSDHCILKVVIDFQPNSLARYTSRYNWSRANMDQMKRDLSSVHWRETLSGETVEVSWCRFRDKLKETVEKNVPKCGIRTRLKNPWMTRALEKETAKKIRNAKRKMERDLAIGESKNNRRFAKYIKSKTKSKTNVGPLLGRQETDYRREGNSG